MSKVFFLVWQVPSYENILITRKIIFLLAHGFWGAGDGDFLRGRLALLARAGAGAGAGDGDLGLGAGAGICLGGDSEGLTEEWLSVIIINYVQLTWQV